MSARRRILSVVGTRPNLVKTAPVLAALRARPEEFETIVVHTGQHYDAEMSQVFLDALAIGDPDFNLGVGSGSHAEQTVRVIERLEPLIDMLAPDLVLVPGDVNSTAAAALAATDANVPLGHIEAGLRSFDRTMPEERNRVITDQLADLLFIHSDDAKVNLLSEGRSITDIFYVGNTMIDTLVRMREQIDRERAAARLGLEPGGYIVVTLHRPTLVDRDLLGRALTELASLAGRIGVVFPAHPRTHARIEELGVDVASVRLTDALGYVEFLSLVRDSAAVLTDSGGVQEETTYLGVPCFTLRATTERPVTCSNGTNTVLGLDPSRIAELPALLDAGVARPTEPPPLWDGRAGERIVEVLRGLDEFRGHFGSPR